MNTWRRLAWAGVCAFAMLLSVSGWCAKKGHAQAPAPQASPQAAAPESGGGGGQPTGKGFAIESEMLTYSAMDAEGETLACNVARNLGAAEINARRAP